jgi:hypothetical protein
MALRGVEEVDLRTSAAFRSRQAGLLEHGEVLGDGLPTGADAAPGGEPGAAPTCPSNDNRTVVGLLLSVTFACGLFVAAAHVVNRRFVAPVYDVVANLTAFTSAVAASALLHHWLATLLSSLAVCCWLGLGRRTAQAIRSRDSGRGGPPQTAPVGLSPDGSPVG